MKFKKIFSVFMIMVLLLSVFTTNVFADIPAGTNCNNIDRLIKTRKDEYDYWVNRGMLSHPAARKAKREYDEAVDWKAKNCGNACPGEQTNPFRLRNLGVHADGTPYNIHKFTHNGTGDTMFCIDPASVFDRCAEYSKAQTIGGQEKQEIALIVHGYNQTAKTDAHYIAAQLMIWDVLGKYITAGGSTYQAQRDEINANTYGESTTTTYRVNIVEEVLNVLPTDTFSVSDTNNNVGSGYHLNVSAGMTAQIQGNKVVGKIQHEYPINKTVTVVPNRDMETTAGDLTGLGTSYLADSSQSLFTFEGAIQGMRIKKWEGDTLRFNTKTGDLKLIKQDEWGRNAGAGIKFHIFKAFDNDGDGNFTDKGDRFITEKDYLAGNRVGSEFVTDNDGFINIERTMIPGHYIIKEVEVTNSYVLDTTEYPVQIKENETITLKVTNNNRRVSLDMKKFDIEEPNVNLDGALFGVWDVSDVLDDNAGVNPIQKNYFLKVGNTVDLTTFLEKDLTNKTLEFDSKGKIATLENNNLTANKVGTAKILIKENDQVVEVVYIYLMPTIDTTKPEAFYKLDSIAIFKGYTGSKYMQVVNSQAHDLPIANAKFTLYSDNLATVAFKEYDTDELGQVDLSKFEKLDDTAPNTLYYKNVAGEIVEITKEVINDFHEKEGYLHIPHLKHNRDYLVCELEALENYDIPETPCKIINTGDTNYPENIALYETTATNKKGRGDFEMLKLDEFLDKNGKDVKFEIYKAKLKDDTLPYYKNWKNIIINDDGSIEKGEKVLTPAGEEVWTVDDASRILINDYFIFGYYVIKEVEVTDPFNLNNTEYLMLIEHSVKTEFNYLNELREVSLKLTKADLEENFRKLNDAHYVVYDISESLDGDKLNTIYGANQRSNGIKRTLEEDEKIKNYENREFNSFVSETEYPIENLYFARLNKEINLKELLVNSNPELKNEVGSLPIYYKLSHNKGESMTIDANGTLVATETARVEVKVFGGSLGLFGTLDNPNVYQNEVFNPYQDLKFYKDLAGTLELDIDTLTYAGNLDTSTLGEYPLEYILVTKDGTKYVFNRTVKVVEDDRPIYDRGQDKWLDRNTGNVIENYVPALPKKPVIVSIKTSNTDDLPQGWKDKELGAFTLNLVSDSATWFTTDTHIQKGIAVMDGVTGHQYLRSINRGNHNLYLPEHEIVLYYDKELKFPFAVAKTDKMGKLDLNSLSFNTKYSSSNKDLTIIDNELKAKEENGKFIVDTFKYDEGKWLPEKVEIPAALPEEDKIFYYKDIFYKNKINELALEDKENLIGTLTLDNLKHSRKYLVCEVQLPEGYDYKPDGSTCIYLDTATYQPQENNKEITDYNKRRRLDIILYKTNTNKTKKLDGAIFDVWSTFEEGLDKNDLTKEIPIKITKDKYKLIDKVLGNSTAGSCEAFQNAEKNRKLFLLGLDNKKLVYDPNNPIEGVCYEMYEPTLIGRNYLGRFVSGGFTLKYEVLNAENKKEPLKGIKVDVFTDKETKNKVRTYTTDVNGEVIVVGLPEGIYYTKLVRPLKPGFIEKEVDPITGSVTIHVPTEADYIPLDQLPEVYKQVDKHYISKGMIRLPNIKYGETLEFKEIKAPSGYYFDSSITRIVPKAEYGIDYMENYRTNNVIIIPPLGVDEE